MKKKNIVICNFPRFSGEIWLPYLWASTKTYYELHGEHKDEWNWVPCYADVYSSNNKDKIKELLLTAPPDIFAISLYVWNYVLAHDIASWVKINWPKCIIITGGPHQYFKHDIDWFKKYQYIDASHPGDCYGELCFKEILDNYDNTTDTVNWDKVTDIRYPSVGRNILSSKLSMSRADKKKFQYDYSALHSQFIELKNFVSYQQKHFPTSMLLSVIETTRGCPYGCTYCDWGGGINTAVIQKSMNSVRSDIDILTKFDLTYLYIADANFGIFSERDIDIIKYIAEQKTSLRHTFKIGYGGFAKTENRLNYIRDILEIDVANELSQSKELKISLQTLDDQILKNIDRKNISLNTQLEIFKPLSQQKKLPLYVEMIMGLPGMTLEKFYDELDQLGKNFLSVQWFEWILLPEAPAYAKSYRDEFGIRTILKNKGWGCKEEYSERNVVVECSTYTNVDYLQMVLSTGLYSLFVQGGFCKNSIEWIRSTYDIGHGKISQNIYENFFLVDQECKVYKDFVQDRWQKIISDPDIDCSFDVNGEEIYGGWYFIAMTFSYPNFAKNLMLWMQQQYNIPQELIDIDDKLHLSIDNFGKLKVDKLHIIDFKKNAGFPKLDVHAIVGLFRLYFDSGNLMRGHRKLLGLFK